MTCLVRARSVLVAKIGLVAVTFVRSLRLWATPSFGDCKWPCASVSHPVPDLSVLVANNGLAAVKFMRSVRSWATQAFGDPRVIGLVAMATPDDIRINAEHVALADQFVEVRTALFPCKCVLFVLVGACTSDPCPTCLVAMAMPDNIRINAWRVVLADQFVEGRLCDASIRQPVCGRL